MARFHYLSLYEFRYEGSAEQFVEDNKSNFDLDDLFIIDDRPNHPHAVYRVWSYRYNPDPNDEDSETVVVYNCDKISDVTDTDTFTRITEDEIANIFTTVFQ